MVRFAVGDQVVIRFGRHQGQKATVITSQPADVYKVKVEDGTILFYSSKGMELQKQAVPKPEPGSRVAQ